MNHSFAPLKLALNAALLVRSPSRMRGMSIGSVLGDISPYSHVVAESTPKVRSDSHAVIV